MWSSTTRAPHTVVLGGLAALLAWGPDTASAQAPAGAAPQTVSARPQTGDLLELTVCRTSATFDLKLSTKSPSLVELPRGIQGYAHATPTLYSVIREDNKLYVAPPASAKAGDEFALRIWGADEAGKRLFEASLHTSVVKHIKGVRDNVVIYHQSDKERFGDRPGENPCSPQRDNSASRLRARAKTRQQAETTRGLPVIDHVAKSGEAIDVAILLAEWEDDDMVIDFKALNPWFQPSQMTEIRVRDRKGDPVAVELIYPSRPATTTGAPETRAALTTIGGRDSMVGSMLLPGALANDVESLEISFHGIKGGAAYSTAVEVVRFEPVRPISAAERRRRRLASQVTVSVRGVAGGIWLADALGENQTAGTAMGGFAVRVSKGMHQNFAFEGEFLGGRSGDAIFRNVAWDARQGDVCRRASFARAQASGVIRFGTQYVVATRLGFGVQAASYQSTFTSGDTSTTGPGDGFEFDGLWIGGGVSLDARVGDHWTLGAGATFANSFNNDARSFEGGLHVSYSWNARSDHK